MLLISIQRKINPAPFRKISYRIYS